VRVRARSPLGLKYLELTPGTAAGDVKRLDRGRQNRPVELDQVLSTFDARTRQATQGLLKELGGGLTLVRLGGHFAGGQVLHWAGSGALLSGDIVQVLPGGRWVSFMYSYPMLIPLPAREVEGIAAALEPFAFDRILGAWWDRNVLADGKDVVRRSAERYVRALSG